jgi:hypothetical protein
MQYELPYASIRNLMRLLSITTYDVIRHSCLVTGTYIYAGTYRSPVQAVQLSQRGEVNTAR